MGSGFSDLQIWWGRTLVAAATGLLLAGCSSDPTSPTAPSSTSSLTSFTSFLSTSPPPAKPSTAAAWTPSPEEDCPTLQIRTGASTLAVNQATTQQLTPQDLRYQLTFVRMARQCAVVGPDLRMRIGVEGRAVVGPAGAPPQVDVPIRYAVVREGVTPKVITTKLRRLSVPIPSGSTSASFSDIEDDLNFPIPRSPGELEAYIVYIGFDEQAVVPERRPAAKKGPVRTQ